jgi:hypothetical protein
MIVTFLCFDMQPGWARLERIRQPSTDLRRACYRIAGYMLTISHIFKQIPFQASRHLVEVPINFSFFYHLISNNEIIKFLFTDVFHF